IYYKEEDPDEYVSHYLKVEYAKKAYQYPFPCCNGEKVWERTNYEGILPPVKRKMPGRPKKARRLEFHERAGGRGEVSRVGREMHCTNCGKEGHNRKTCKEPITTAPPVRRNKPNAADKAAKAQKAKEKADRIMQKALERAKNAKEKAIRAAEKAKEKAKEKAVEKAKKAKNKAPIAPGGFGVLSFENGDQYVKLGMGRGKYYRKDAESKKTKKQCRNADTNDNGRGNNVGGGSNIVIKSPMKVPEKPLPTRWSTRSKAAAPTTPLGDDNDVVLLGEEPPAPPTAQPVRRSPMKTIDKNVAPSGPSASKRKPGRPPKANHGRDNPSFSKTPGRKASGFQFLLFGDEEM
ncbi:hypothetical protein FRX31_013631, partial [Thalictrum thalictroides]